MRRMLSVAMFAVFAIGVGLVVWEPTGEYSVFCPADGRLGELDADWGFSRDHRNGCEWTLYGENGERAPREVYIELGVDPPPDYPFDWDVVGWTMIVGSMVAGIGSLRTRLPVDQPGSA